MEEPIKKQNGGKRPGAGRPKGSGNKLVINDFMKKGEVKKLVKIAKELALNDRELKAVMFLMEQLFGKAKQSTEVIGNVDLPFIINITRADDRGTNI